MHPIKACSTLHGVITNIKGSYQTKLYMVVLVEIIYLILCLRNLFA